MKKMTFIICTVLAAVLLVSGCSSGAPSSSSAPSSPSAPTVPSTPVPKPSNSTITDGVMTTSVDDGSKPTGGVKTSFPVNTAAIYCSFKVNGVSKDDMIKAAWIYVGGAAPAKANTQINETYDIVQTSDTSYYLAFYLDKPAQGWDKGDYKVVLSINNKEKLTVPFKVE
jgi:hypothetical protein